MQICRIAMFVEGFVQINCDHGDRVYVRVEWVRHDTIRSLRAMADLKSLEIINNRMINLTNIIIMADLQPIIDGTKTMIVSL